MNLKNHGLSSFAPWMKWSKMKTEYSKFNLQWVIVFHSLANFVKVTQLAHPPYSFKYSCYFDSKARFGRTLLAKCMLKFNFYCFFHAVYFSFCYFQKAIS